jgi:hypothetical protein
MRRPLVLFAFAAFGLALAAACAPAADLDDVEVGSDALTRRLGAMAPPAPKTGGGGVRPPIVAPPLATAVDPGPASPSWCGETRFDLRRVSRTCEDLPGAYLEGGKTFVPGNGGRFEVERTLAGTEAPPHFQARTCTYTWRPSSCAAPDTTKLLVEEPTEQLVPRAPGCEYLPGGCSVKSPPPSVDGGIIPTGLGRCEVCGFATGNHLWAILPADYSMFSYWAGNQRRVVQLSASQEIYEMDLGVSVPDQNVTLYKFDSAPLTQP